MSRTSLALIGPMALIGLFVRTDGVRADGPLSAGSDCGGDAFSTAEVVERRAPRRGPLTALPETLCADLAPQQPPVRVDIRAIPILTPEVGGRGGRAPYDEWPRRGGPPRP